MAGSKEIYLWDFGSERVITTWFIYYYDQFISNSFNQGNTKIGKLIEPTLKLRCFGRNMILSSFR